MQDSTEFPNCKITVSHTNFMEALKFLERNILDG